jgi:putative pre-16S rRNA nuclease
VRILGIDFGRRRIGMALSDATATLASPWRTVPAAASPEASAGAVAELIQQGRGDDAAIAAVVVGFPQRLGGGDTDQTQPVRDFVRVLGELTGLPVHTQDERLTSHEADARLAMRERDWRRRKEKLDAAAAAIILQDYLDARARC